MPVGPGNCADGDDRRLRGVATSAHCAIIDSIEAQLAATALRLPAPMDCRTRLRSDHRLGRTPTRLPGIVADHLAHRRFRRGLSRISTSHSRTPRAGINGVGSHSLRQALHSRIQRQAHARQRQADGWKRSPPCPSCRTDSDRFPSVCLRHDVRRLSPLPRRIHADRIRIRSEFRPRRRRKRQDVENRVQRQDRSCN